MPPENDQTQEIDISELIERIESLEEKIHRQTEELKKIESVRSGLEARIKELEGYIESIVDHLGIDSDDDYRSG